MYNGIYNGIFIYYMQISLFLFPSTSAVLRHCLRADSASLKSV